MTNDVAHRDRRSLLWRVLVRDASALVALVAPFLVASLNSLRVPGIAWTGLVGYVGLLLFPAVDPRRRMRWDQKPLPITRLGLTVVCAAAALFQLRGDADSTADIDALAAVLLLGVLGNAMPVLRPNWFFGVRTPWTLRDDAVWTQTHRVAGHALVATSLLLVGLWSVLEPGLFVSVYEAISLTLVVVIVAYSWWVSRRHRR